MDDTPILERLVRGAVAGLAGTLLLQVARTASEAGLPGSMPPIRMDPGEYMVHRAEAAVPESLVARIPDIVEAAAAKGLAAGYGITAGAVYGVLRPRGGDMVIDGTALGIGTWMAGYLGWLPVLGLMPPIHEQTAAEVLGPIARHVLFGIAVVGAHRALGAVADG